MKGLLVVLAAAALASAATADGHCRLDAAIGRLVRRPHEVVRLKDVYADKFLVGTCVSRAQAAHASPDVDRLISETFNCATPENEMKPAVVQPREGQWDFAAADAFVDYAESRGMAVIGHCLVWHNQVGDWMFVGPDGKQASRELLVERMRTHIRTVVTRYRGRVKGWDVVNEALEWDGSFYRPSKWYQIIGEDFVELAFKFAHEADPDAELYYNDWDLARRSKANGVLRLVRRLKSKGLRIDAVGMQSHMALTDPDLGEYEKSMEDFIAAGVNVMVTELDVSVLPRAWNLTAEVTTRHDYAEKYDPYRSRLPAAKQQELADRYAALFRIYLRHADKLTRVTFWGAHDGSSWLNYFPVAGRTDHPLLYDRACDPKPCARAIEALAVAWPAHADFGPARNARMEFLDPGEYKVADSFWSPKFKVWRTVTLPDVLDKFEGRGRKDGVKDDWFANFDHVAAGERANGAHKGPHFANGLVYEAISGASDYLLSHRDPALAARLHAYAARIAAAQETEPDGYLNTHNQLCHPQFKWGENGGCLVTQHEIWNLGMLIEAGVRHWRATQDTTLLACAVRAANLLCDTIGPSPRHNRVPTHTGPEEPVVLLARIFRMYPSLADALPVKPRPDDYIALVEYWMRSRGRNCGRPEWGNDFDAAAKWISVHADEVYSADDPQRRPSWGDYAMDRIPLSEYNSIEGHAVRATLLGCGLAALARETGDDVWASAAKRFWDSMVGRKMYITGGVGALSDLERFGPDYFLPPAAYLETCAAVGSCFYSARLAELTGDGRYVDEMERVIYNALLTAVALDGHNYTYQNPLESDSHNRWDWHWCPCCPPMFLKLTGALPGYVYSRTEDGIAVNLYIAGMTRQFVNGGKVRLRQETRYPFDGKITITFDTDADMALRLRIPGWARGIENPFGLYTATPVAEPTLAVNGKSEPLVVEAGYVTLRRAWRKGDTVTLTLDCSPRVVKARPEVADVAGRVALAAGPLVYAFEKTDNPDWDALRVPAKSALRLEPRPDFLGGVSVVTDGKGLLAIPYYAVANRGTNVTFGVWMNPREEVRPDEDDFIRVRGPDLVDGRGAVYRIRGINLGNWLLPEGYMFGFGNCNSAHFIDEMFRELVGVEETRAFWRQFKDAYITAADIARLKALGINTVRVPFSYKLFTDEDYMDLTGPGDGFGRLDDVIGWCRQEGLRVVLDMHACPGGNTGDNIDDSHGYPGLFESDAAQALYCAIWQRIAARYADEPAVLGYDLMNEPIAHHFANADELNKRLEAVQFRAIDAIRQVDRRHVVMLAGGQWNTNFYMYQSFDKDPNMMYTCHHYAFGKPDYDDGPVRKFAAFRDKVNRPMYMGETGHNAPAWCAAIVKSMDEKNIGWTFWPYKMAGRGGWFNFPFPEGWKETVSAFAESDRASYAKIREHRPDRSAARRLMDEFIRNCRCENAVPDTAYLKAIGVMRTAEPKEK